MAISTLAQISAQYMKPRRKIKRQENISLHTNFQTVMPKLAAR